jgi:hypothetical protein
MEAFVFQVAEKTLLRRCRVIESARLGAAGRKRLSKQLLNGGA